MFYVKECKCSRYILAQGCGHFIMLCSHTYGLAQGQKTADESVTRACDQGVIRVAPRCDQSGT